MTMKLISPRPVPLGGLRAMTVRRLLPSKERRMIGAWCFVDHYGPDDVAATGGMRVAPHPHTGLQTASWIFTGTVEHRDSLGTVADVRPGELNLMTAGHGINHSEYSTADTSVLHGVQLWIALPATHTDTRPAFENFVPLPLHFAGEPDGAVPGSDVQVRVFLGELSATVAGQKRTASSPVATFSPLLGAEILVGAPASDPVAPKAPAEDAPVQTISLGVNPDFELGILVDTGAATVNGQRIEAESMLYLDPGTETLTVQTQGATRLILLGGAPFGEQITMWWNFIGRSHSDIETARAAWQEQVKGFEATVAAPGARGADLVSGGQIAGETSPADGGHPRFGGVVLLPASYGEEAPGSAVIPAPALPPVRLKPRGD